MPIVLVVLFGASLLVGCGRHGDDSVPTQVDDVQAMDALYQCLLDKGVPATRGDNGSVDWKGYDEAETARYEKDEADCMAELGDYFPIPTVDDLRRWYQELSALRSCLIDAGFPMADDWPTEEVYVESKGAYGVDMDDLDEARMACPAEYEAADSE